MARVLVVEDQMKLLQSLRKGLEEEGYEVLAAATGEEGYYHATTGPIDAIVLDLMLPGRNGLEVLRDLRAQGFAKPILILTARDAVDDRVRGLDGGADDYLIKPFAFAELLARRVLTKTAAQVAQVLTARGLDAREDSHTVDYRQLRFLCHGAPFRDEKRPPAAEGLGRTGPVSRVSANAGSGLARGAGANLGRARRESWGSA